MITTGLGQLYNGEFLKGLVLNIILCLTAFLYSLRLYLDGRTDALFFTSFMLIFLVLKAYSIGQAFVKSRRWESAYTLRKYNKLYVYAAFTIIFLVLFIVPGQIVKEHILLDTSGAHPFRSEKAKERYLRLYDGEARIWPIPSETRMVDTSFGQTFVRISGPADAPPLVLIHGANATSLMWAPNIEVLSADYKTYAPDNIFDLGRSVFTKKVKTPDDFVNWLDELFNALKLEGRVILIGQSYGGWIAGQYLLHHPDRLEKVVLLAPATTVLPFRSEFLARGAIASLPFRYFTKSMIYWILDDLARKDETGRNLVEDQAENVYQGQQCFKPKQLVNPTVLTDQEWQSIKVPTLFLVGENEKIYSARKAIERLKRVAPQIKTDLIPNAGHGLTLTQADLVNRKILEFLRQPGR